ncbi:MAG: hypothetical protein AAGF12_28945 [Myxococcota bacterium]
MPTETRPRRDAQPVIEERFSSGFVGADAASRRVAIDLCRLAEAKGRALAREEARIAARHGRESERAQQATARRLAHQQNQDALCGRAEEATIGPVRAGVNSFVLHGRVVNEHHKGLSRLRVDATGRRTSLATDTTNSAGYFQLELAVEAGEAPFLVRLEITRDGTTIQDDVECEAAAGRVTYRTLRLPEGETR